VIEDVTDGYAPRFSPDGRRIALRASREGGQEIWVYDAGTATLSRLTFQGGTDYPVWSPRGDTVYYSAAGSGTNRDLYRRAADGSGVADTVLARPGEQWEIAIAPNGEHALVREIGAATGADLLVLPLRPRGELRPWVQTPFAERSASIAPDSRWAAYVSNESGPDEVYVRAFPEPSGRWQVSTGGGSEPLWSRDGRTIYYRRADTLYAVSVTTRPTFATGPRRAVLAGPYQVNGNHTNYDRNPRTGEFVFLGQTQSATLRPIVVLNWFAELRARAGTGR
jgi:Tol biopolymer transport system component